MVRVVLCDSHEIALAGLRTAFGEHGFHVAGTAHNRTEAMRLLATNRGAVVLVDMELRGGEDAATQVLEAALKAGCTPVAMGVSGEPSVLLQALRSGARGYLTKDLPMRAWADAIGAAARGEAVLSRSMTAALVDEYRAIAITTPDGEVLPSDRRLTTREWQVLELVAEGRTNRSVAAELSISVETVRTHVSKILAKLETPNRSAAVARYHRLRAVRA